MSTKSPTVAHTCYEDVREKGRCPRYHHCGRTAKVEREGKWYCGTHDPVKRKENAEQSLVKYRQESEERAKQCRLQAAAPQLLAALEGMLKAYSNTPWGQIGCHFAHECDKARAAIQAAKGE